MSRPPFVASALLGVVPLVALLHLAPAQAQTVGSATNFPAGTNPIGLAIGDLNRDGRPDIVVTNGTPGAISVLLATGNGTFGAPTSFPVGAMPQAVALADLNRDGILDAVVVNTGGNSVSILPGNGTGGFGARTDIPVGVGPTAVAIGDLDGDGRLDLVVTNGGSGTVTVLLGNVAGGFSLVGDFLTGPAPSSVALADVTGDNLLDVIVGNRGDGTVSVLPGIGGGLLGPRTLLNAGISIVGVAVGDFNRDGRPDIAVADAGLTSLSVQLADGAGGFRRAFFDVTVGGGAAIAVADLNGDGRTDLVLTLAGGASGLLRGDGTGVFTVGSAASSALTASAVAIADFDRDGLPDIVTAHPAANVVSVRLNTTVPAPAGAFVAGAPRLLSFAFSDPRQPVALLLADVDSFIPGLPGFDGVLDVLAVDTDDVSVGFGTAVVTSFPSGDATVAILVDVNRDGLPDLILGQASGRISVRLGSGQTISGTNLGGTFGPTIDSTFGLTPIAMAVGDLDRDGIPDLVVAGADSEFVATLRGTGTGAFTSRQNLFLGAGSSPSAVALADLERDGILDVIVAHTNGISVFPGDGAGGFGARKDLASGVTALGLAVGDVNRDGKPDLVFSAMDGTVRVLLVNGAGGFGGSVTLSGFVAPSAVALADLNRDGVLDLVVLDGGAGVLSVSPGAGNGNFGAAVSVLAGLDPAVFAIGDVDGDGRLDLVVLSAQRQLRVLLNDGAGAGTIAFDPGATVSSVVEATGSANITITRSGGTAPATIDLAVTGTAVFGVDYQLLLLDPTGISSAPLPASTATLTFAQGETTKRLILSTSFTLDNSLVSADRTVVLTLSNAGGGAVLGFPSQQTVTLTERDEALSFSQAVFSVTEGNQAAVTVKRRGDLKGTVTVGFKTVAGSAAATDFASTTATLTFAPGVAQLTFSVKANADAAREGDETVALLLTAPRSTVPNRVIQLESPSVAQLTVLDGNAAVVSFASATASVAEGATVNVTLTRSGALTETATASVALVLLSASAGDFTLSPPAPATIVFAPGIISQSIQIAATSDTLAEGPESFRLQITNVTSGGRSGRIGAIAAILVTIADDDSAFSFADPPGRQIPESAPTATFTVLRSGPLTGTATVQARTVQGASGTAIPGVDYQTVDPTTLTFPPGVATRTFTVPLLNDTVVDGPKLLQVALSNPTGGPALGTQNNVLVTLLDDDEGGVIQWQKAATNVMESASTAVLTVTRTLATPGRHLASGVTVNVTRTGGTATPGTDFAVPVGSLTFTAGQATQTVTVPITADAIDEPDETVLFTLSSPTGDAILGPLVTTTLTIADDDEAGQIQFAAATATVAEDNPATVTLRVTRTGKNLASAVTVNLAVTGGTAIQSTDFTLSTGTLTFAASEAMKDLVLSRVNDALAEGPETIVLTLSNPTGGAKLGAQRTMVVTLTGPESAVGFGLPAFSVAEGTAVAALTVLRAGPLTSAATVQVRTLDGLDGGSVAVPGVDYLPVPPTTLTFPPGMASRTVAVPILNNTRRDGTRTVTLALSNPSAGLALGTQRITVLAIADNDEAGTIGLTADSVTVSSAAGVAVLTVTRTGKGLAGGISVDFVATFRDFTTFVEPQPRQAGTLVFAPGQTSKTITLPLSTDPRVRDERGFVQLSNPTGGAALGRARAQIFVTNKNAGGTLKFTTSAMTVVEGTTALLTVTRTGGLAGGVSVPFFITDGQTGGFSARSGLDFVLAQGTLFFDEGDTSKTIPIPILADALLEGPETFQVSLVTPQGGAVLGTPSQIRVTIVDNEALVGFARSFVNVSEGMPAATVTVLRSGPLTGTATVQVRTVEGAGSGSAVPDLDYRPVQKTLTFGPGVATQTVTVPLLNDTAVDGDRIVNLELSNPSGMALGTTQRRMGIIIADNETGGFIQLAASQFAASEAAGVATIRVVRSLPGVLIPPATLGSGVTVDFVVTGITATSGADFTLTSGTVTFGAGETFKDIVIPLTADGLSEGPESLTVTLQNPSPSAFLDRIRSATVTIVD